MMAMCIGHRKLYCRTYPGPVKQRPQRGAGLWGRRSILPGMAVAWILNTSGCASPDDVRPTESYLPDPNGLHFVDIAAEAGLDARNVSGKAVKTYIIEAKGGGIGLVDYNGNGLLDVYLLNGSSFEGFPDGVKPHNRLFANQGDGTFVDVTRQAGVGDTAWSMGCVAADFNNNGHQDIYVTNYGPNRLYQNQGDGTFVDVAALAGVADARWGTGATFGDVDGNGYLDLYVVNYLDFAPPEDGPDERHFAVWRGVQVFRGPESFPGALDVLYRNLGNGTFEDVTAQAGLAGKNAGKGFQAVFLDFDNSGRLDLYVAADTTPNQLYQNEGNGRFVDISLLSGASHNRQGEIQAGMGVAVGDYNNNGFLDMYVTHFSDDYNTLYRNEQGRYYADVTSEAGMTEDTFPFVGWGTEFVDFDNDGFLDLFVANGHAYQIVDEVDIGMTYAQPNLLFHNQSDGRFVEVGQKAGSGFATSKVSRGAAFGDIDNDGDIDILVLNIDDTPTLLRNEAGNRYNWLKITTRGTQSNRDGIGARIDLFCSQCYPGSERQTREVRAGSSFLSSSDLRAHFGLGQASQVDSMKIRWPSGVVQRFVDFEVNQWLVVVEEDGLP